MIPHPHLFKAALTADALNLGPHWVYNQAVLASAYPKGVSILTDPLSKYHPGKAAGDLTHYGDNLTLMLRTVSNDGAWDRESFIGNWQEFWSDTTSYRDGATEETLSRLDKPNLPASTSNDIAGASMALALTGLIEGADEGSLIATIREQTGFAHRDLETMDAAEFFTRVILRLRAGDSLYEALEEAASANHETLKAQDALQKATTAQSSDDHLKVAAEFGLTCHTPDAFPLVLYYLLRYPTDIVAALSDNALAGGDNAARALIIAIVLAAANGWDGSLDESWQAVKQQSELAKALAS
ncbi:MAG: ADP-ribosylglycohydrolase family protein [Verrucomicrobiales bacterium]|nr:ADP-ribosylglycohydrolase family protein [Verrucomicrobiales bacterium]